MRSIAQKDSASPNNTDAPIMGVTIHSFASPEHWAGFTGWQARIRQLEAGPVKTELFTVNSPRAQFNYMEFNRRLHQQGIASKDYLHFGVPVHKGRLLWHRTEAAAGSLIGHNDPGGYEVVSDSGLKNFLVSIKRNVIEDLSVALDINCDPDTLLNNTIYNQTEATVSMINKLQQFYLSTKQYQHAFPINVIEDLESNLPLLILESLRNSDSSHNQYQTYPLERTKGLARALEYINHHATDAITVQEVCQAASVNWRTLERAFQDQFSMTPKAYLKAVRLNGARKDLLAANSNEKVADIANAWGFWHLSQFAADYKKLFGELPKASLGAS